MIGNDASGSGSNLGPVDMGPTGMGPGHAFRRKKRSARPVALGCLAVALLVGGVFWRQLAIASCFALARFSTSPRTVAWGSVALAHLGPTALPALVRLLDRHDHQRWWSAREAIRILHERDPEANAAIHDLLASSSDRVRAAAATMLVDERDPSAVHVVVEELSSPDPDVRVESARALSALVGTDVFDQEVRHREKAFERTLEVLEAASRDTRTLFEHGDLDGTKIPGEDKVMGQEAERDYERCRPRSSAPRGER